MENEIEKRQRKEYQLYQGDIDYVEAVAKRYNVKPSIALSKIISEHKDVDLKWIEENMKKLLSVLFSIRKLDKVTLEILNSLCLNANYQNFTPTSEFKAAIVDEAFKEVNKDIAAKNITRAYTK